MNILHWPASYPDPSRGMPYHCIFIEEHVKSVKSFANNRVLFISPETTISNKWVERTDTTESDIVVTRFYFNRKLNLQFLNIYIRIVLFFYFFELIILKNFRPNILHLHFFTSGTWALLFAKLFNIKVIVTEHWTALIGYPEISEKRLLDAKIIYEKSDWTLPVSTHLKNGIEERTHANIAHKCSVIHNSVDTEIFKVTNHTHNLNQLITVIRLDEQKDIPTMLKTLAIALTSNPNLKLNIIGGGDSKPFQHLAHELHLENAVSFLGPLPKTKISDLMNQSDLFILSSIAENSPCVIGEAHCCGLPVVATDVGGVKELIMEGGVVPPKSPELLAEKILEQLDKKVDRANLAQKAQARFSYDAIGQQIFEVYQNVCVE
jgi:glycosyltransferase involved in cell wall biosynthesis